MPLRQSRPAERLELKLERYLLARTRPRPPQRVLSRTEHWKSGRGAYATREGLKVDNLRVLLVDDVLTTGATLYALRQGAQESGRRRGTGSYGGAGSVRRSGSAMAAIAGRSRRKPS